MIPSLWHNLNLNQKFVPCLVVNQRTWFAEDMIALNLKEDTSPRYLLTIGTIRSCVDVIFELDESYGKFHLGSYTGDLSLNGSLDYTQNETYTLMVRAFYYEYERGSYIEATEAPAQVIVNVIPENLEPPIFENFPTIIYVCQYTKVGDTATQLFATDPELNSTIEYTIGSDSDGYFSLNATTGILKIAKAITSGFPADYHILISAVEIDNVPQLSTILKVDVKLCGKFTTTRLSLTICENSAEDTTIDVETTVFANVDITSGNTGSAFIVSTRGDSLYHHDLRTNGPLDREYKKSYRLYLTGTEVNGITFNDRLRVDITVCDVNDNSPEFDETEYVFTVCPYLAAGFVVGEVTASDSDSSDFSNMLFVMEDNAFFEVNNETGIITTKTEIHPLSILNTSIALTVFDSDISVDLMNDTREVNFLECPAFLSSNMTIIVSENGAPQQISNVFQATVPIFVNITAGNEDGFFEIQGNVAFVNASLDFEYKESYLLEITGYEENGTPLKNKIFVEVLVQENKSK